MIMYGADGEGLYAFLAVKGAHMPKSPDVHPRSPFCLLAVRLLQATSSSRQTNMSKDMMSTRIQMYE
jgi:hypothetical protein